MFAAVKPATAAPEDRPSTPDFGSPAAYQTVVTDAFRLIVEYRAKLEAPDAYAGAIVAFLSEPTIKRLPKSLFSIVRIVDNQYDLVAGGSMSKDYKQAMKLLRDATALAADPDAKRAAAILSSLEKRLESFVGYYPQSFKDAL